MWRVAAKVAVSATLIAWLLWRTPVGEIGRRLSDLDPATLLGVLFLTLATWFLSAVRLWVLAPELGLLNVTRMTFVALYYGTVLPGQVAGDVMKAYRLSHAQSQPGQSAAATLVDRVVATFALFLLGACTAPWVEKAPRAFTGLFAAAAAAILAGMLLLAMPRVHAWLRRWLPSGQPPGWRGFPGRLVDALHRMLKHPLRLAACFLLALVFHALCVAIHIVLARPLGIAVSLADWILVYAGVSLLLLLPVSVAGVGLREGGYVGMLALFGIDATRALSLSLVIFSYLLAGSLLGWIAEVTGRRPAESAGRPVTPVEPRPRDGRNS